VGSAGLGLEAGPVVVVEERVAQSAHDRVLGFVWERGECVLDAAATVKLA
jgi:hypothetical protein